MRYTYHESLGTLPVQIMGPRLAQYQAGRSVFGAPHTLPLMLRGQMGEVSDEVVTSVLSNQKYSIILQSITTLTLTVLAAVSIFKVFSHE